MRLVRKDHRVLRALRGPQALREPKVLLVLRERLAHKALKALRGP